MVARVKKNAPALKHGGYSATALLPGEDPAALQQLHEALIAEFSPVGALEEDIVASIVRLVWRKRQLDRFQVVGPKPHRSIYDFDLRADLDPDEAMRYTAFIDKKPHAFGSKDADVKISSSDTPQEAMKKYIAMINEPQEQEFVRSGEITTIEQFMSVLAVEERLDTMIDRCLKRLLFLRGLKSLAPANPYPRPCEQKRSHKI